MTAWSEHAATVLADAGHRTGGARRAVIDLLADQGCALSAQELEAKLGGGPRKVARASVYRVLEELERHKLVARVEVGHGRTLFVMPFGEAVLGRPGFLHGGAIAGLLEFAAYGALRDALDEPAARIKPVGVTVDFLRGGAARDTFAAGTIRKLGRRIASVEAAAWQEDEARPIAVARMNLLLA